MLCIPHKLEKSNLVKWRDGKKVLFKNTEALEECAEEHCSISITGQVLIKNQRHQCVESDFKYHWTYLDLAEISPFLKDLPFLSTGKQPLS